MNVSGCGSTTLYLKMGFRKHKMSKMLVCVEVKMHHEKACSFNFVYAFCVHMQKCFCIAAPTGHNTAICLSSYNVFPICSIGDALTASFSEMSTLPKKLLGEMIVC